MALQLVKLIGLLGCILIILFAPPSGAEASLCLTSAAAVKSAYPAAHPHWTMRAHTPDGAKCWHPGTQVATHKHLSRTAHHRNPIASPTPIAASRDSQPNRNLLIAETNGTGWSLQVPTAAINASSVPGQSSFAERFSAIFEVVFFERPSLVRYIESRTTNMP